MSDTDGGWGGGVITSHKCVCSVIERKEGRKEEERKRSAWQRECVKQIN